MRSTTRRILVLAAFAASAATADARVRPASCPTDVAAAIDAACPCAGRVLADGSVHVWLSHGAYERCASRAVAMQRRAGCLSLREAARQLRCAERSTCGRGDAVLCAVDAGARMRVSRNEDACVAAGGEPMGTGSVCTVMSPTPVTTSTTVAPTTTTSTSTTLPVDLYGNPVEFGEASQHAPGFLLGGQVTVGRGGTLVDLGVIGKAGGASVVLGLYADAGGAPGRLVVVGPPLPVEPGAHEVGVAPTPLAAGSYWLMAVYDADASVGLDESDADAVVAYTEWSAGDPLPDPFPPAASYNGQRFNYYLRVQR